MIVTSRDKDAVKVEELRMLIGSTNLNLQIMYCIKTMLECTHNNI